MTCLWKLVVQVSVVLRKTVGGSDRRFDSLSGIHLQSQKESKCQVRLYLSVVCAS